MCSSNNCRTSSTISSEGSYLIKLFSALTIVPTRTSTDIRNSSDGSFKNRSHL